MRRPHPWPPAARYSGTAQWHRWRSRAARERGESSRRRGGRRDHSLPSSDGGSSRCSRPTSCPLCPVDVAVSAHRSGGSARARFSPRRRTEPIGDDPGGPRASRRRTRAPSRSACSSPGDSPHVSPPPSPPGTARRDHDDRPAPSPPSRASRGRPYRRPPFVFKGVNGSFSVRGRAP